MHYHARSGGTDGKVLQNQLFRHGAGKAGGTAKGRVGVLVPEMFWRVPGLDHFLAAIGRPVWLTGLRRPAPDIVAIAGWGRKKPALRARRLAERWGLPFFTLEDGFMRSAGLGVTGSKPWSVAIDGAGVHYEATPPSAIENDLQHWQDFPPAQIAEAGELLSLMRQWAIGKYNDAPDLAEDDPCGRSRPLVLVVDQTKDDASIAGGRADDATFTAMLAAALAENPGAEVRVKVHPDVLAGKREGFLLAEAARLGVALEQRPVSWPSLARRAARVYVATSHAGFEALVQGTPVICFGLPFYAGWGLTDDRLPAPWRQARPPLEALVAAAYVRNCRYIDPVTGGAADALAVARHIARLKRGDRDFAGLTVVLGAPTGLQPRLRRLLASRWGRVDFAAEAGQAVAMAQRGGGRVAVWSAPAGIETACASAGVPLWWLGEGLLAGLGLGADAAAASLLADSRARHDDPERASDLETLLATGVFSAELLAEAAEVRATIVRLAEQGPATRVDAPPGRRRILVPGETADDSALLQAVRAAAPDAFIVHLPVGSGRPDVADQTMTGVSARALFGQVDEIHTRASAIGFEALLRGLPVTTHGAPFYAGWGLTTDLAAPVRRQRRLSLDALVAGALILHPRHVDPESGLPCDLGHILALPSGRRARGPGARLLHRLRRAGALIGALTGLR